MVTWKEYALTSTLQCIPLNSLGVFVATAKVDSNNSITATYECEIHIKRIDM